LDFDYHSLLSQANQQLPKPAIDKVITQCVTFCLERYKQWHLDKGEDPTLMDALLQTAITAPHELDLRLAAVKAFVALPEAEALASANKRIHNLLKKNPVKNTNIKQTLFIEQEEHTLFALIQPLKERVQAYTDKKQYQQALLEIAKLKPPVDAFFDQVLVMTEDPKVQQNRLALLHALAQLCNTVIPMRALAR
jgi:glycyl-tRNA synthetase beta chain